MSHIEIIAALREKASEIKSLGAISLYLFGSAARGEATEKSDVALFVDYDPDQFSFVELIRLRERLSDILGRPPISRPAKDSTRSCGPPLKPRRSRCCSGVALTVRSAK